MSQSKNQGFIQKIYGLIFPGFKIQLPVQIFFTLPYNTLKIFNPAGNYMFKVNSRNTRTRCEICSKLTIKIPERRQ